jgi:uncharacterized repeat protein (TIGR03806 family)
MHERSLRILVGLIAAVSIAGCGKSSGGAPAGSGDDGTGSGPGNGTPDPPAAPGSGLDARPANPSCIAPPIGDGTAEIELTRVFANLDLSQPLGLVQAPDDPDRWYALEKTGRVLVFANDPDVTLAAELIDLNDAFTVDTASEGGLLGMAFHPDFAQNGEVFLSWTSGPPMVSVIARFTSADDGATLDPGSVETILTIEQDFANHNGGHIAFGNDGLLYIGFGDGGSGGDPLARAQDTTNLLGSMLRIDVDGGSPYAVPPGNPFAANPLCPADPDAGLTDCPEIYAWGLRNPWRWSFDRDTGALWLGDVGQGAREEIDLVTLGGNYGWDCREGSTGFGSPSPDCSSANGLIDPVHDYPRSLGFSITGGYVYRGSSVPGLVGNYLFADYGTGRIWRLVADGRGGYNAEELLDTSLSIASFGEGNDGELYVIDIAGGAIYRIDQAAGSGPTMPAMPTLLSATGCVDPAAPTEPASGLIPYDVAAPFWSDGAEKSRWLALPDGTAVTVDADGDFALPDGAVAMKHFMLGGRLIETRLLMRHPGGNLAGYSYAWDADETDATLVTGGRVETIDGQDWVYPSSGECDACHTTAAGGSLGLETAQLNGELTYPATGRTANQLLTLDTIGALAPPLGDPAVLPALVDPADPAAPLEARARAYLHTNCAQCHRPGGPTPSDIDLRYATLLDATETCDVPPQAGDLGIGAGARIIAPGDAASSVIVARMDRRDASAMPPLASSIADSAGVILISEWIDDLERCL